MKYLVVLLIICSKYAIAQENVVPNPDFESYLCIPVNTDDMECIQEWYNPNRNTPDYMHSEGTNIGQFSADVPKNGWGIQEAHSGEAYITLHLFTIEEERDEYLQVRLLDSLIIGQEYEVSIYTSLAESSNSACNGHSFLFSKFPFSTFPLDTLNDFQMYVNSEIIEDAKNWVKLEGVFIAENNYKYLTLGNFILNTAQFQRKDFKTSLWASTYYFDDISVRPTDRSIAINHHIEPGCLPVTVLLSGQNIGMASDWTWIFEDGSIQKGKEISATFEKNGKYKVLLSTIEDGKEYRVSQEIIIEALESPIADFVLPESPVHINEPLSISNSSYAATSYHWDFGNGTVSEVENPVTEYNVTGDYIVKLTVSNASGCTDEMEQIWHIACQNKLLANTFTPNGDGDNDVFPFENIADCGTPITIQIFNRWGSIVYQNNNPLHPWDGGNLSEGTYYYKVTYKDGGEAGSILLIRGR